MFRYPYAQNADSEEFRVYTEFSDKAEQFVQRMLQGYSPTRYRELKVIHDPVWGTVKFYPWELQIMDSPLLQRLRNINQLGLAVYTYPSAHHSRFEHTLGVVALVTRMAESVNDSCGQEGNGVAVTSKDINKLRLAALLHDVGHCFFSHLSESMYGKTEEFQNLKASFEIFKSAQPHEILGYVIINTNAFKEFFKQYVDYPDVFEDGFFDDIGRMIVGAPIDTIYEVDGQKIKKYYLTEMINGQFDADSLDYLRRDSYITGLSLTYHIDRFLYKIKFVDHAEAEGDNEVLGRHLTVSISGVSTVEEMIFGKQMLTRYIYQHQKVLATDVLVYDVVNGLKSNGKLQHPCDYLYYTDDDIFKIYDEGGDPDFAVPVSKMQVHLDSSKTIADVVKQIKDRDLPKKALVLNLANIRSVDGKADFTLNEAYLALQKAIMGGGFRQSVHSEAVRICEQQGIDKKFIDLFDIFYSVPKPITAKNYTDVFVATHDGGFVELKDVADLNDWAGEFSGRSWNAYVFSSSKLLPIISLAAKRVLESRGITFVEDRIFAGLKHADEIEKLL